MRRPTLFPVLSLLLLIFVSIVSARLGPEDYWNKYVNDQYIPEAIKGMIRQEPAAKSQNFLSNFDTRRFDAVVYHTHRSHEKLKEE